MKSPVPIFIAVVAVAALAVLGYRNLARTPQPPVASVDSCAPEAIRTVNAPVERAILSAQCNKLATRTSPAMAPVAAPPAVAPAK
ncbi:entry exclusion lipoprotein TrbK [Rugamonas sp.]|uniref:entry exclusion lipoprotein TrbK n=1 Tax=Rugamonas sp. TaxID=1926287 RepID=UPI0025FEE63F|nr:entry exclusion lipoprotein TrbK [Rugamonas sp.]